MNNSSKVWLVIIGLVILLALIGGCSDSDSGGSYGNGYSNDYNNDSDYRDNVDYISDVFGEDSKDVDNMIQGLAGAMK